MPGLSKDDQENNKYLLIRLDERMISIQNQNDELKKKISSFEEKLERVYVSKEQFIPVQRAVYAAIGVILSGFLGILVSTFMHVGGK